MTGILIKNGDRPDIVFEDGSFYGGIHCGECFQIYDNGWVSVRLEYGDNWFLVGHEDTFPLPYGRNVML